MRGENVEDREVSRTSNPLFKKPGAVGAGLFA
jgi:hypothetical protein